jgi:hypothetical protein
VKRLAIALYVVLGFCGMGMHTPTALAVSKFWLCWGNSYATMTTSAGTTPFESMRACLVYVARGGTPRALGLLALRDVTLASAHIYLVPSGTITLNGTIRFGMLISYPYKSPATAPADGGGTYTTTGTPSLFGSRGTFTVTGLRQATFTKGDGYSTAPDCRDAQVRTLTVDAQFTPMSSRVRVLTQLQFETTPAFASRGDKELDYAAVRANGRYPYYWLFPGISPDPAADMMISFTC